MPKRVNPLVLFKLERFQIPSMFFDDAVSEAASRVYLIVWLVTGRLPAMQHTTVTVQRCIMQLCLMQAHM